MLGSYLKRPQLLYHGKFVLSETACPVTVRSYHACVVNLSSLRFEFLSRQRYVIACSSPSLLISLAHHHWPTECTSSIFVILKFKHAHLKFPVCGRSKRTSIDTHTCEQCSHASVGLAQARPNHSYPVFTFGYKLLYKNQQSPAKLGRVSSTMTDKK